MHEPPAKRRRVRLRFPPVEVPYVASTLSCQEPNSLHPWAFLAALIPELATTPALAQLLKIHLLRQLELPDLQDLTHTCHRLKQLVEDASDTMWKNKLASVLPAGHRLLGPAVLPGLLAVRSYASFHQGMGSGACTVRQIRHTSGVLSTRLSPDDRQIAVLCKISEQHVQAKLVEVLTGKILSTCCLGPIMPSVAASPHACQCVVQYAADSRLVLAVIRALGSEPGQEHETGQDHVACLGAEVSAALQVPGHAQWAFCPLGQLVVSWSSGEDGVPLIRARDPQLQPIWRLAASLGQDGQFLNEIQGPVMPGWAQMRDSSDRDRMLNACCLLSVSLHGVSDAFGQEKPIALQLSWNAQGGLLALTGSTISYKAAAAEAFSFLIPHSYSPLINEMGIQSALWLPDRSFMLISRHAAEMTFVVLDPVKHCILFWLKTGVCLPCSVQADPLIVVSPDGRFLACLDATALCLLQLCNGQAVLKHSFSCSDSIRSATWNAVGDSLLVERGIDSYLLQFGCHGWCATSVAVLDRRLSSICRPLSLLDSVCSQVGELCMQPA